MTRFIEICKGAALISFCILCICLSLIVLHVGKTVTKLDTVLDTTDKTVHMANDAIYDSRLTMKELNRAAMDERHYFETQLPSLMSDVHNTILTANSTIAGLQETEQHVNTVLDATSATVTGLQPVEAHLSTTLSHTDAAVDSLNTTVSNPVITKSLTNIETATAAGALATQHAEAILKDGQEKADAYVHPPKKKLGFWGSIWAGAQVVHKLSPPLF